jgi:GT2 family glycosyltransferase
MGCHRDAQMLHKLTERKDVDGGIIAGVRYPPLARGHRCCFNAPPGESMTADPMPHAPCSDSVTLGVGGSRTGQPRVSIVLLTYNCAHRLEPILTRLCRTGLPLIAVDNGSRDGTADVLDAHPGVQVIRLQRNVGASARSVGAEMARTPYVAFCDDDGWYESDALEHAADLLDMHPTLALVNARILVGDERELDPISAEMADSPLLDRHGLPGSVLLSFMAGAVIVRLSAFFAAGGYDARFFMGGEEETLAHPLAKLGWQMRYVPEIVMFHHPSMANAASLRAYGMRNTVVNAWLHRPLSSALRWTLFTLADTPKNRDYVRGLWLILNCLSWIAKERAPMSRELDQELRRLDARRFATRQPLLRTRGWRPPEQSNSVPPPEGTHPSHAIDECACRGSVERTSGASDKPDPPGC